MNNRYNIENNIDLSKYSKFCVGGKAEYFFAPKNIDELISFIKDKTYHKPVNIVGAGSNILFDDGIIKGTVISTEKLNNIKIIDNLISAECGVLNSKLFNFAKNNNIGGFEFLGCIPGSVGGSCKSNAGCYKQEIKDVLFDITTIDYDGNLKTFSNEECGFTYRNINLDKNLIFLNITFKIDKIIDKKIIEDNFKNMLAEKIKTQPIKEKTCGSTFKNNDIEPAWKTIQKLGLQDVDFDGVKFSEKHANFLINNNSKNSKNIKNLIDLTIKKAKNELNIDLELEIQLINNENDK